MGGTNKIEQANFSLTCRSLELMAEPSSLLFCFSIHGACVIAGGSGGKCKGMPLLLKVVTLWLNTFIRQTSHWTERSGAATSNLPGQPSNVYFG